MAVNLAPFGIEVMQDSCGFFFVCLLMHLFEFVHDLFTIVDAYFSADIAHDMNQKIIDFLDYMNGIINHPEGYIASLQKDVDHYVNSGKWVEDMDKLEYEMNEVARKVKIEDAKKLVLVIKRMGGTKDTALQELTNNYGDMLSHDEIIKLVHEVYQ